MSSESKARGVAACALVACAVLLHGSSRADGPAAETACTQQDVRVSSANRAQLESSLLCLTNAYRAGLGLAPVLLDTRLGAASRAHSVDMAARSYFDHVSPEGTGPEERAAAAGYPGSVGENIAYSSQGTIRVLFEAWRDSPGHQQNMLDPGYRAVGIGLAVGRPGGGGITGTQLFGDHPANTSETGKPDPKQAGVLTAMRGGSKKCRKARRALRAKRTAYRKAPWATSRAKVKRLRAKMRKAKRRYLKACRAG